ncbi:MAG: hypothetical protein IMF12_04265, partial [Proteobacteria bacterium]|nr:hypothetical protein [Pseudomonadota bacterium]
MTQTDKDIFADDTIFADDDFVDEDKELSKNNQQYDNWKIFIVDDEKDVHQLTRFVLEDY